MKRQGYEQFVEELLRYGDFEKNVTARTIL
jgi:hypothetical protein